VVFHALVSERLRVLDDRLDLVGGLAGSRDEGDAGLVEVVGGRHRDRQFAGLAVVRDGFEERQHLAASGGDATAAGGRDPSDHLVGGRVRGSPELRAPVPRPPALLPVAGGGDPGGRVVGRVAPVRVVLRGADASQPHVGVREKVVRPKRLARVVHVEDVVLDPLREVVGRLVDRVRRLQRLLRRLLF